MRALAKLVGPDWIESRRKAWGESSPTWQVRVLGDFPSTTDDTVCALSDVEGARARTLEPVLRHMLATVIEAGGRFYLAKDHWLTRAQYRQSVGAEAMDTFLELKQHYDPEALLQSDLFQRVFQPAAP